MSERRHRLYSHEIPEVVEGLVLRLERLLERREEPERAEVAFSALFRLEKGIVGRPRAHLAYEVLSWKVYTAVVKAKLESYLGFWTQFSTISPALYATFRSVLNAGFFI